MSGVSVAHAGSVLTGLEDEDLLRRGREVKIGRGFFYVPAPSTDGRT